MAEAAAAAACGCRHCFYAAPITGAHSQRRFGWFLAWPLKKTAAAFTFYDELTGHSRVWHFKPAILATGVAF